MKRILDIVFVLVGLPFLMLLYAVVFIAIKLDDGGPVLYITKRVGKYAQFFNMLKFRTMRVGAPDIRLSDGSTYSAPDDDRVTRVGRFLRKTSLDETPQLINILFGQMSLIGPRPDPPDSLEQYTQKCRVFLSIRPGITGYNQAYFRNSVESEEKISNDIFYAENYSFAMDVKILLKTIVVVFKRENIYREASNDLKIHH